MEILFLILKIIGICILVLIGIFLFLILSILFIPVRYRIKGKGEVPKTLETDAVFSWFLHVIHGRVCYGTDGFLVKIRIFGIPLRLGQKKPKKEKRKRTKEIQELLTDSKDEAKEKPIDFDEPLSETQEPETKVLKEEKEEKPSRKSFFKKLSFKGIKEKCKRFWQKLIHLKEQLGNIKNIILEETNRNAATVLFREFKGLMKHYTPRKASGELQFGTEDPANTGQILGIISLFPFWYRYKISVIPDFTAEGFYAKGELFLKGHIRSAHLLASGMRLIKNKDIRKLINQIRT